MRTNYTVREFCNFVERDLHGLIKEVTGINRNVSDTEKKAMAGSYPIVSEMLKRAMLKEPGVGDAHISTTNMLLEYKLPAASAWCDLVLLGKGRDKHQVIILELKNYHKNKDDAPGRYEGLMIHRGEEIKHPADQVKGYTEYCRFFHSEVLETGAEVNGCVYFTQPIDLTPYRAFPNDRLTRSFPMYNSEDTDELSTYVASKIQQGDDSFATRFVNGFYKQNRNILRQVAENLDNASSTARPFVLLDEQRRGFNVVMGKLTDRVERLKLNPSDEAKEVIIVQGPPGSGKSAVAVNIWIEAVKRFAKSEDCGNIVFVTTSSSQKDNWESIYDKYGNQYSARSFIISSNSFAPFSMNQVPTDLVPAFRRRSRELYFKEGTDSLKFEYFREYTEYMVAKGKTKNYRENNHFLSVVDEAHALWNPTAPNYSATGQGYSHQCGPQAYHIIYNSRVSVFLMDGLQSFRDFETTSVDDIKSWAKELGAKVSVISLDDMQFRCSGSKEYVDWVDALFTTSPLRNHDEWCDKFKVSIVDYPSDMEAELREYINDGETNCRILSSYTQKWVGKKELTPLHDSDAKYDFDLEDRDGKRWQNYWNNPANYQIYVQASKGTAMEIDPLSEVGCPYVVRGFDYDHVGILWLDDLIIRDGKWYMSIKNVKETAVSTTRAKAVEEQKAAIRAKVIKGKMNAIDIVPVFDPNFPMATALFQTVAQAYRILFTRGIRSVSLYIKDKETREYVRNLLKSKD